MVAFLRRMPQHAVLIGVCVFVLSLMVVTTIGRMNDFRMVHSHPYTFLGYDHFLYLAMSETAAQQGHYRSLPSYLNLGINGTLTHIPPGPVLLPVLVSTLTGLPSYDAQELSFLFLFAALPIPFLCIFRKTRMPILLFSIALLPFLFKRNFLYATGKAHYGFILGAFLFFAFIAAWYYPPFKRPLLLASLLAGMTLSHPPQLFFCALFLIGDALISMRERTWRWKRMFPLYSKMLLLFLIFTGLYLVIFAVGSFREFGMEPQEYRVRFIIPARFSPTAAATITDFYSLLPLFLIFGIAAALFSPIPHRWLLFSFLAVANLNYFAFLPTIELRAFQYRFLWPILLALFFGIGIHALLRSLSSFTDQPFTDQRQLRWGILLTPLLAITFVILIGRLSPYGISVISAEQYAAWQWIAHYTPPDAEILFLYGDGYDQSTIIVPRPHARVQIPAIGEAFRDNSISDRIQLTYDKDGMLRAVIFNVSRIQFVPELFAQRYTAFLGQRICDFDYIVMDTRSTVPVGGKLVMYNAEIMQRLSLHDAGAVVFQNNRTVIVQNLKRGGECV